VRHLEVGAKAIAYRKSVQRGIMMARAVMAVGANRLAPFYDFLDGVPGHGQQLMLPVADGNEAL
jgi:hypothetical protein